jgi:hypothetical protein
MIHNDDEDYLNIVEKYSVAAEPMRPVRLEPHLDFSSRGRLSLT